MVAARFYSGAENRACWCVFFWSKKEVCCAFFSGVENLQRRFYLQQKFYSANFSGK